ncbi:allene oxide cyclase barrel-like domain-containing protein [Kitasatospora aureofaciens]|uniref:allene oxide cyclase barrel-like domain-containing protein n=1 Tax=Kitasatospora aureofaciens TaxID=1894 RepID=UPI0037C98F85
MAFGFRSRTGPAALAGLAALSTAAVLLGPAGTDAAAAGPAEQAPAQACLTMKDMTETIVDGSVRDLGGPYPHSVGGSSTYLDHLFDPAGKKVATLYGKANVPMTLSNGDMAEFSDERIEFSDGVIETAGFYDITNAETGTWQYLPAIGVEGRYRGMVGKRHFQITTMGKSLNGWIELCPAGQSDSTPATPSASPSSAPATPSAG